MNVCVGADSGAVAGYAWQDGMMGPGAETGGR